MRKYQPAWERLKRDRQVSLKADPSTHTRIFYAIRKEKNKDLGYKVLCDSQGLRFKLSRKVEGDILTLALIQDHSLKNL